MSTIPNELKITINTSIPGFQSIRYKPSMTLPKDKTDDNVQFNPLVKLKPSVIKTLPENIQKKEFFNKGLFQSLIYSHGLAKKKSLVEATKEGYIDNNIKVTLETIFPSNSVIYINKQPYVIYDLQWTSGDWKIDKKTQQMPQLENTRLIDPYLYNTIVKDEIISGDDQLEQIPKEVIYGSNYTGPPNVASGIKPMTSSKALGNNNLGSSTMGSTTGYPIKPPKPFKNQPLRPLRPSRLSRTSTPSSFSTKTKKNNAYMRPPVKPVKPISAYLTNKDKLAYEAKEREIQSKFLKLMQQQKQLLQQDQFLSQQLLNQETKLSREKRALFLQQQQQIAKEREKLNLQKQVLERELNMLRMFFESYRLNMFRNKEIMDSNFKYPPFPPLPPLPPKGPNGKPPRPPLPPPGPEIVEDEEITIMPANKVVLETSQKSTDFLKNFFGDKNYYFMLNVMFQIMDATEKDNINTIFKQATKVDAKAKKGLSKSAYDITIQNMRAIKNAGGGDCFFIAIADAINYYNVNTPVVANKIVYQKNYGIKTPFTQLALRQIVAYFILYKNTTPFEQLISILEDNADSLNALFKIKYQDHIDSVGPVTPVIFLDLINNIYHDPEIESFLVKKPTEMTAATLDKPFRMIAKNELETYIASSDYWGNTLAIDALCVMLGLNVIVLEKTNDKVRIPYMFNNNNPWDKYLFIFHESAHYELITFDYLLNKTGGSPVTKTIFRNNFLTPPFYIIFLIFASYYFKIDDIGRNNFKLLSILMKKLLDIYTKIKESSVQSKVKKTKQISLKFLEIFNKYFLKPPRPIIQIEEEEPLDFGDIYGKGGALSPYQYSRPHTRPYQYQSQYQYQPRTTRTPYVSSFIKNTPTTQIVTPQSNISYYITIDMFLKKGTELSDKDKSNLKCNHRWNSIRKNYADLRGIKYTPRPDYSMLPSSSSSSSSKSKSKTQKMGLDLKRRNNKTKRRNYLSS